MKKKYVAPLIFIIFGMPQVFAENDIDVNLISYSESMKHVIFDGKWTFPTEWKISSAETIKYENDEKIYLRTAHYDNYFYIMINFETDMNADINSDKATICFDPDNQRALRPTENSYCFTVTLGQNTGKTFQGGSDLVNKGYLRQVDNFDGFIAISKPSDENDRYNKNPHPTFEFKIPIDAIGRTDNYGFFMSVYEANSNKFYTWPKDLRENTFEIPSPQKWGMVVSPDKSIPEFPWSFVIVSSFLIMIVAFSNNITANQKFRFQIY